MKGCGKERKGIFHSIEKHLICIWLYITLNHKHIELFRFFITLQISYQSIESFDPSVNVPGPRRTVSKLKNETYHMFSGLQPGTTYLVSVRARTAKGFGQTTLTEITTNISGKCGKMWAGARIEACVNHSWIQVGKIFCSSLRTYALI